MIVAIVALVVATAGTATAARLITGAQIETGTITSRNIKNNTIRSRDVRNHSLLARDFRAGQLPRGPRGFTGAPGPRGPAGPAGQNGTNGFGVLQYPFDTDVISTGTSEELDATCPAGTFPTGGAASAFDDTTGTDVGQTVVQSQFLVFDANGNPVGYGADFSNTTGAGVDIAVEGVCANANQVVAKSDHRHRAK
jgi:hypothetical protein